MTSSPTMPAAFFGHGNPMNALERNRYTEAWRAFGAAVPRPRAILVVSAHWYINATAVTAMARPRTIHDFYGFPPSCSPSTTRRPALPELAEEIAEVVKPTWVGADTDSWGIDHGTWSVLVHAFPDADIPVVQLSINATKAFDYHLELGAQARPAARARGARSSAAATSCTTCAAWTGSWPTAGFDWAQRFDEAAKEMMTREPDRLPAMQERATSRPPCRRPTTSSRCCTSPGSPAPRTGRPTSWSTATPTARCP